MAHKSMHQPKALDKMKKELKIQLEMGRIKTAERMLATHSEILVVMATKPGWSKPCHCHSSDKLLFMLDGDLEISTQEKIQVVKPGDNLFTQKYVPHTETNVGNDINYFIVATENVFNTTFLPEQMCQNKNSPQIPKLPAFKKFQAKKPLIQGSWYAEALLHPFSPLQNNAQQNSQFPFFQMVIAKLCFNQVRQTFHVKAYPINSTSKTKWTWLFVTDKTGITNFHYRNPDGKVTGKPKDFGWRIPVNTDWLGENSEYIGSAPLNYMSKRQMDWWKRKRDQGVIWFWCDNLSGLPFRLMYGEPPSRPDMGLTSQLPFFQMFSVTYFAKFKDNINPKRCEHFMSDFMPEEFFERTGLTTQELPLFKWPTDFGMSSFMTSVYFDVNPMPTRVFYRWRNPRKNFYNPSFSSVQIAEFHNTYFQEGYHDHTTNLQTKKSAVYLFGDGTGQEIKTHPFAFCDDLQPMVGQLPPDWPSLGRGEVHAIIKNPTSSRNWTSVLTGSNHTVPLISLLFPPNKPYYPCSTFAWIWYDYSKPTRRPIMFMQSASKMGVGTNLVLSDYFDFHLYKNSYQLTKKLEENYNKYCKMECLPMQ